MPGPEGPVEIMPRRRYRPTWSDALIALAVLSAIAGVVACVKTWVLG